ncbi:MAG TPA: RNA methyltransferase [Bacillota bacterium]|nr:RNA methyltransferase [Bacillota bacterium]
MNRLQGQAYDVVKSASNKTIKKIRTLQMKKHRDKSKLFILEGTRVVEEALQSNFDIELLVISESNVGFIDKYRQRAAELGIPVLVTSDHVFSTISDTKSPQGLMAIVEKEQYFIEDALANKSGFIVILDGIKDPGNLGTIVRTADAAGAQGLVLINDCVDLYNPKAVRSTMGSILRVPVYIGYEALEVIGNLRAAGYHIAVSHLGGHDIYKWGHGVKKTALVIGSEDHGVSTQVTQMADSLVKIPIVGQAESLNASVAAGILIYEFYRKGVKLDKPTLE